MIARLIDRMQHPGPWSTKHESDYFRYQQHDSGQRRAVKLGSHNVLPDDMWVANGGSGKGYWSGRSYYGAPNHAARDVVPTGCDNVRRFKVELDNALRGIGDGGVHADIVQRDADWWVQFRRDIRKS